MNSSKKILLPVAAIAAASIMFALGADEHDGHDHSGHSHAHENEATKNTVSQKASPSGAIIVTEDKQSELGVEVAASARPRPAAQHNFEPYTIDRWLHNEEAIDLGDDQELVVLQTPGHTPDSLCLWYAEDQILFTGDTIIASEGEDTEALHRSATLLQSTYRGMIGKRQTHQRKAAAAPKPTPKKKKSLFGALRSATALLRCLITVSLLSREIA